MYTHAKVDEATERCVDADKERVRVCFCAYITIRNLKSTRLQKGVRMRQKSDRLRVPRRNGCCACCCNQRLFSNVCSVPRIVIKDRYQDNKEKFFPPSFLYP